MAEGIETRHETTCARKANSAARCRCTPRYRGHVWDSRAGRLVRGPWRASQAEAKTWRVDALQRARLGMLGGNGGATVREAGDALLSGMRDGSILNRSGDTYKPSVIRGYESALEAHVFPELGSVALANVGRSDVQALADALRAAGKNPSTVRNALMPLRVLYRRAVRDGAVSASPVEGVELAAVRGRRDRIASPAEAALLIERLPSAWDRALWGTALYAGLRLGELRGALREDFDLDARRIYVRRSLDAGTGEDVGPKTTAGTRTVPIIDRLHELLVPMLPVDGFAFGVDGRPFGVGGKAPFRKRATEAWAEQKDSAGNVTAPKLEPIGMHECRHTYASLLIAAGANAKTISTLMGHASITITFDRYGHLMPGGEDEAAKLLDRFLDNPNGAS